MEQLKVKIMEKPATEPLRPALLVVRPTQAGTAVKPDDPQTWRYVTMEEFKGNAHLMLDDNQCPYWYFTLGGTYFWHYWIAYNC